MESSGNFQTGNIITEVKKKIMDGPNSRKKEIVK